MCLCQTSVGRGHGKSEPRSVGVLANAHGMTLLLQRTKHQNHNSTCASLMALVPRSSGLPVALSAPRHGDFPRSISGSKLPVCSLRGHAFPALKEICQVKCNLQTTSCSKLQRQSSNVTAKMNLLPIQPSYKQTLLWIHPFRPSTTDVVAWALGIGHLDHMAGSLT